MSSDSKNDASLDTLVEALAKFREWESEYALVRRTTGDGDAAGVLMQVLGIPQDDVRVLIGGSNAPIFSRATRAIVELRRLLSASNGGTAVPDMAARLDVAIKGARECPSCGQEMARTYIECRHTAFWCNRCGTRLDAMILQNGDEAIYRHTPQWVSRAGEVELEQVERDGKTVVRESNYQQRPR